MPKIRKALEARCRAPRTPQRDVKRARIVLLAAEGRSARSIAEEVGVEPRIVSNWRRRFAERGLGGLNDRPRAFRRWRDNVFVERLWRSAKYEEVYLRAYDSISDARNPIGRYLDPTTADTATRALTAQPPIRRYFTTLPLRAAA